MNISKQNLKNTVIELIYIIVLFIYIVVIIPLWLDKFNIFQSFMFRYLTITIIFFSFGCLLALQHFLSAFTQRTLYTFCYNNIMRGFAILIVYFFILFNLILNDVLENNELLQMFFILFSIFIGYNTISSFKLTVRLQK